MVIIDIDTATVDNSIGYAACFINTKLDPITGPYTVDNDTSHAVQYAIYKCIEFLNEHKKGTRKIIIYTYSTEKSTFNLFDGPYTKEIKGIQNKIIIQFVEQNILDKSFRGTLPNRYNAVHNFATENALVGKYMFLGLGKKKQRKDRYKVNTYNGDFDELNKEIKEPKDCDIIDIKLPTKKKRKGGLNVKT